MEKPRAVLVIATLDTKGTEARYLLDCFEESGTPVLVLDAGILGESPFPATITREQVACAGGMSLTEVRSLGHEGQALSVMIAGATRYAQELHGEGRISGITCLGGSMGTTLGTGVMRTLPIGFPKVMISTMASRNTRPFVGTKDILMLHALCDLAGLNRITRKILRNGATAMAGMVRGQATSSLPTKPLVVLSTLGTTETCSQTIRRSLETEGKEVVVFHTVGSGGEAMEELIHGEEVEAVVDLSLHEVLDGLFGGDYDAGPNRGSSALRKGIPTIIVPGNTDFLVTGPLALAEQRFPGRVYHVHNAAITCIRSEPREVEAVAKRIAEMCNEAKGPVKILVPTGGFSAFDRVGGPFHDPTATRLFGASLKKYLKKTVPVAALPYHINDPEFAKAILDSLEQVSGKAC